jgi:hypothetical protein
MVCVVFFPLLLQIKLTGPDAMIVNQADKSNEYVLFMILNGVIDHLDWTRCLAREEGRRPVRLLIIKRRKEGQVLCLFYMVVQITLTGAEALLVKKGDRYGFSWESSAGILAYEVIGDKENIRPHQFCEADIVMQPRDVAGLVSERNGKRRYSIMLKMEPDCGPQTQGECGE